VQSNFAILEHDIEQSLESALDTAARRARNLAEGCRTSLRNTRGGPSDFESPVRAMVVKTNDFVANR
jgi:hypothetical protein